MRQRNPTIRPLFGAIIVLALGYNDWTLHQKLATLRLLESGAQTRQRYQRHIDALNRQADLWEAKADAMAKEPAGESPHPTRADATAADDVPRLAAQVRTELIAAWIDRVYGPSFHTLALSPADWARFKALITQKRQAVLEAIDAANARGVTDAPGLRTAIQAAIKPVNAELESLLGSDRYDQFREYQSSLPARSTVAEMETALAPGASLSASQSDALVKIIAQGQTPESRLASGLENLLTSVPADITAQDVTAAAAVLSPAQQAAMQTLQAQAALRGELLRLLYP